MLIKGAVSTLVLAFVLAAMAGGGSASASGETNSPTRAQFITRGDKICSRTIQAEQVRQERLLKENGEKPPLGRSEQEKIIVNVLLPPWTQMSEGLFALELPVHGERGAEAVVGAYRSAVRHIGTKPLSALETPFSKADRLAAKFGFKVCPMI